MRCEYCEEDASEIIPKLWLGNYKSSVNKQFLKNNNIKYIIRIYEKFKFNPNDPIEIKKKNIIKMKHGYIYTINNRKYYHFPIIDKKLCKRDKIKNIQLTNKILSIFNETNKILFNGYIKKYNMLVHCKMGHHRSATVVAAFLMKYLNMNYKDTVSYIHSIRRCALRRNTCMVRGLYNYSKQLKQ